MTETPKLSLELLTSNQAQKHVTINEAFMALDSLTQLAVKSNSLSAPPSTPAEGDAYIVGPTATGLWTGHEGQIAVYAFGFWTFYTPRAGWLAYVESLNSMFVYHSSSWVDLATYLDSQLISFRSEHSSLAQFLLYRSVNDFWAEGHVVRAGEFLLTKRTTGDGDQVWLTVQTNPARLQDMYLSNREGSVKEHHLAKLAAKSVYANVRSRPSQPQGISILEMLQATGYKVYGESASGGIDFVQDPGQPNAPTAIRSGSGTSIAGETSVVFAEPFASSVPAITVAPIHATLPLFATINSRSVSGFSVTIWNATTTPPTAVAAQFSYIATANGTPVE